MFEQSTAEDCHRHGVFSFRRSRLLLGVVMEDCRQVGALYNRGVSIVWAFWLLRMDSDLLASSEMDIDAPDTDR